jgi:hypothetical protein
MTRCSGVRLIIFLCTNQVREATAEVPDVLVNLAHVYMQQGQYVSAIKMVRVASLL